MEHQYRTTDKVNKHSVTSIEKKKLDCLGMFHFVIVKIDHRQIGNTVDNGLC